MLSNYNLQSKKVFWLVSLMLIVVSSLLLSGCSDTKAASKVHRVGILNGFPPFASIIDGFKGKMTELGYVEGENIIYDIQTPNFGPAAEQSALEQFVADEVDLIFVFPTGPSLAAKNVTKGTNIPVVFAMAGLEGNDLVESVSQPGGNVTGVRFAGPDSTIKRLEFLLEIVPQTKRLYITYNKDYPASQVSAEALRPVASSMGITLIEEPVASVEELQANLQTHAAAEDIDAILVMPDDLTQSPGGWPMIAQFAAEHNIPIGGAAAFTADTGALFSYVADFVEVGEEAAPLADKILNGTPAGTIPVITPVEYLRINYKAAEELGLTVPDGLLGLASEVIR